MGPRFTWKNKQLGSNLIMERLDRVFVSHSWMYMFPHHIVMHEPITCSDHAAIIIYITFIVDSSNKRPYKLKNWCLRRKEIIEIIISVWAI